MNHGKMMGACLMAAMFVSVAARADEDSGFYLGAGFGQAKQESGEFDGADASFKFFGGWLINKYLAIEGGYIEGGTQTDQLGSIDAEISSDGVFVAGLREAAARRRCGRTIREARLSSSTTRPPGCRRVPRASRSRPATRT